MVKGSRLLASGKSSPLPYDAEVDYIGVGSSVGPYIDTGYRWTTDNIKIDIEFTMVGPANAETGLFGSQKVGVDTNWGVQFWHSSGGYGTSHNIGSTANVYVWTLAQNQKYHFVAETTASHTWTITIDGEARAGTWSGTVCDNVTPVGLFTLSNGALLTPRRTNNVNVHSFKLTDNGVLVRNMIPVRKDGVGYMYDLANPTGGAAGDGFYGNAGTGAFLWAEKQ